mgnify:CR=1 FL=1
MLRKTMILTGILFLLIPGMFAQSDFKFEFAPHIGYTFSEGVDVQPIDTEFGTFTAIPPISSLSWGFTADYVATDHASIGFLFSSQMSTLEGTLQGEGKREFSDMKVNNYHGIFTYNFNDEEETLRPFIFGGLGATQYDPSDYEGQPIEGNTRFSTTWGGGVKVFATEHVGVKLMGRWTPTYIKSEPGGIWCGPWVWGCWVVGEPDYSHQFELSAGLNLRF